MLPSINPKTHTRLFVGFITTLVGLISVATLLLGPSRRAAAQATTATSIEASAASWSVPANLGPFINSTASDQQPAISPDSLSLYFTSNRTGGVGGFDMYVSQRASVDGAWGSPVNIAALNTTSDEGNPAFSR